MAKKEPENVADLARMIDTSTGWFDGTVSWKDLRCGKPYEVGMESDESVHVAAREYSDTVEVYLLRNVVSKVRSPSSCSLEGRRAWSKEMSFDEFRASEWWPMAMEKFKDGSCDASEVYVMAESDGEGRNGHVEVTAQCERRYRDFLGNSRTSKDVDKVVFWLCGNGDAGFSFNGDDYEFSIEDLAGYVKRAREFEDAGVKMEDGMLTVELEKE